MNSTIGIARDPRNSALMAVHSRIDRRDNVGRMHVDHRPGLWQFPVAGSNASTARRRLLSIPNFGDQLIRHYNRL